MAVSKIRKVCIFCGSSPGRTDSYVQRAGAVGQRLAELGVGIVYGGGSVGLMGAVADGALAAGGEVVGVIPHGLADRERMHGGLTTLHTVASMHERKALMAELADAFVALPGGMGTLEELCEIFTWGQLGIHRKPFGLLNVDGYFDPFVAFLDHMVAEGFLAEEYRALVAISDSIDALMNAFERYEPNHRAIWLTRSET